MYCGWCHEEVEETRKHVLLYCKAWAEPRSTFLGEMVKTVEDEVDDDVVVRLLSDREASVHVLHFLQVVALAKRKALQRVRG